MNKIKKGQAAMEFMMTYGWAILAFLLIISVLAYLGFLNPNNLLPDSCGFPSDFTCVDFAVTNPNIVSFTVRNNDAKDIQVQGVGVEGPGVANICSITSTPSSYPVIIKAREEQVFVVMPCTFSSSSEIKDKYYISISYTDVDGYSNSKKVYGQIYSKREG